MVIFKFKKDMCYFLCMISNYKNLKFKRLINDKAIDLLSFEKFVRMKEIKSKCYLIVNFSKLISYKKILSGIVVIDYNQIKR